MLISNGNIFLNSKILENADIVISDEDISDIVYKKSQGKISVINNGSAAMKSLPNGMSVDAANNIDATGLYVLPGLVDIHLHGCMGHDFCEGTNEAFEAICRYELSQGVTSICPATMTIDKDDLRRIFSNVRTYTGNASTIQGVTMEGPFLSNDKKGAQNADFLCKPDLDFFCQAQSMSGGMIRQVAVAPEEDTDLTFIKEVTSKHNTVCSLAHSTTDYETAKKAFEAGANHVTHLYNGMNNMTHRSPGIPGAAYDNKDVFVELITDGIHIDPSVVRMTFDLFGSDRICMISDSMEATGLSDGNYSLGGQAVMVNGKLATLTDGTIAGSASSLMDCLRVAVKSMGIPLEDAVKSCTSTPARSLGIDNVCGSIGIGRKADLLLLDSDLNIIHVIKYGKIIY